jgi:hypothetical protein
LNYRIIGRPSVLSFDRLLFTILHNIEELPEWAHALYVFVAQVFPSLSYYSCMLICCTLTHCEISDLVSFLVVMLCDVAGVVWRGYRLVEQISKVLAEESILQDMVIQHGTVWCNQ